METPSRTLNRLALVRSGCGEVPLHQIRAHHTRQDIEKIRRDTERDYWMTAGEAKQYGVIDTVLSGRELAAVAGTSSEP